MAAPAENRFLLPFLCVGHSIDHMMTLLFATVVLGLESIWGQSYGELLALSIAGFFLFGAGAPLAGWLADRWSATGMMVVFFVGIGLAAIGAGLSTGPWTLAVGLAAIGLFASIYHPVGIPLIVQTAGERRGRHLGINGVFGSFGMAVAPFVAGALMATVSWRAAFIVPGLVSIAIGIAFALRFRGGVRKIAPTAAQTAGGDATRAQFLRIMIVLAVITVCTGMVFQSMTVGLPKILDQRISFFDGDAFWVSTGAGLIFVIGGAAQLLGGLLADRFPLRTLFLVIYGTMLPLLFFAAGAVDAPLLLVMVFVIAVTVGNQPVADSMFASFVPAKWLATAFGFRFALSIGVSVLAVPLVGLVFDLTGEFRWLFLTLFGFAALVVVATVALPARAPGEAEKRGWRRLPKPMPAPAE